MKIIRFLLVFVACIYLDACGGKKVKPEVLPEESPSLPEKKVEPVQESQSMKSVLLNNDVDKYSYALGLDLGKAVANINIPVNVDVVFSAMQDVVDSSREVLMTDSESEKVLQELLQLIQKRKDEEAAGAARKALMEQAAFLAQNIKNPIVRVTTKGVQFIVLKSGTGIKPKASDRVRVHYVGTLMDGSEFDNSVKRGEPLEFPVGAVIEGWQDLLLEMREGMKVKAWIPSALAYGAEGVPPTIPANSMLIFEVELLKVLADGPGR